MADAVDLSLRQFSAAWRALAARDPGRTFETGHGAELIFTSVPIAFFNVALLTGRDLTADALEASARGVSQWASGRGVPWMLTVTHDRLAAGVDDAAVLDRCGLAPMMQLTGMVAERIVPAAAVPAGLELSVPADEDGCTAILDINALAYSMPLEAGQALIGAPDFWTGHVPALGRLAGKPASSAAVLMVEGYRYVALVATDPAVQRRGFAEATMRHALQVAADRHGELPTFLHATEAGRPVYERMGYSSVSRHSVFMEKRFLEHH
jgi:GNAT superfamily N-acetyltransferase